MKILILAVFLLSACSNSTIQSKIPIEYRNDTTIIANTIMDSVNEKKILQKDTTKTKSTGVVSTPIKATKIDKDSILRDIQSKIAQASAESFVSKDPMKLTVLEKKLDTYYTSQKNNLILYWKSYLLYNKAIFHLSMKDNRNAELVLDSSIDLMEEMENKNSDDYALLAMLRGLSFTFKSTMKAPFISSKIKANLAVALELDSTNIRAYYVQGNNDFYTPKKYGGGTLVIPSLQKAISLPDQNVKNPALPSWGKEESYEMLIKHYIKLSDWELAKKYFSEANLLYPNSYRIKEIAVKLIGK
jgi:hypothetical protein